MQWGSRWQIATHAGINPFCLCCCQKDQPIDPDLGGSQFGEKPNPFLRVKPPEPIAADGDSSSIGTPLTSSTELTNEFLYATETFDRQQLAKRRTADSRWLRRHRAPRVPVIDDQLVVAFQKFLRIEEIEFLMLITAAMDDDECCH